MLRIYCVNLNAPFFKRIQILNLFKLSSVVVLVFAVSLGPFIQLGQLRQLLERLFPFKRGLLHSYWAPNFWALYTFVDLILGVAFKIKVENKSTLGIVGLHENCLLPNITPLYTWVLTLISIIPSLYSLWKIPSYRRFILTLSVVSLSAFMFGWHVHEKAILLSIIPMALLSCDNGHMSKIYIMLSTFGNYALHPLIFTPMEAFVKPAILISYSTFTVLILSSLWQVMTKSKRVQFSLKETSILMILPLVYIFTEIVHPLLIYPRYMFLPLMFTSVTCSVGLGYVYLQSYALLLKGY